MTITEAKQEYNKLLDRYQKAVEYFDRVDITQDEKEKYFQHYNEILYRLNFLLGKIVIYTEQEIMEGFKNG